MGEAERNKGVSTHPGWTELTFLLLLFIMIVDVVVVMNKKAGLKSF